MDNQKGLAAAMESVINNYLMPDLNVLKDFSDLGGVFILALLMFYSMNGKLDKLNTTMSKSLALLAVLVRAQPGVQSIQDILCGDGDNAILSVTKSNQSPVPATPEPRPPMAAATPGGGGTTVAS